MSFPQYILEKGAYSDATDPDTDGDSFNDKLEIDGGSDPNDPFSRPSSPLLALFGDADGDGLNNGGEIARSTNPKLADTDGDGVGDGDEVVSGTDPNNASDYQDNLPPVLTLVGPNPMKVGKNSVFLDPGASVSDNVDAPETITSSDTVDTAQPGTYTLRYQKTDRKGNVSLELSRTVIVAHGFDDWRGPHTFTEELAERYAFGGGSGPDDRGEPPAVARHSDHVVLSVLVRTNDPNVTVWGEAASDLAGLGNPATRQIMSGTPAADQSGVPDGFERREFRINANGAERGFMRVRANISN